VADVLDRARALVERYDDELRRLIPPDAEIFDAHVHVGSDIDGFVAPLDDLLAVLRRYGVSGAFAFCLDEPDRHPGFCAANDRTMTAAAASDGLLIPFVRLDLTWNPVEEARRCIEQGARGIKLHPRSQGFHLRDERLAQIFELAAELSVPILIHGGRGLPPIAEELGRLVDANPGTELIVAHGGIADLALLAETLAGRRGVFFDTSLWSAVDLLDVFSRIPPEQVLYASDYPYGMQPSSLWLCVRTARLAGFSDDQLRDLLGRLGRRIADRLPPPEPSRPVGPGRIEQPLTLARIHGYLCMASPLIWARQPDHVGVMGLALNACAERDGLADTRERIAELVSCARDLWQMAIEAEEEGARRDLSRQTARLIHLADITAVTATD
jgi:predicted TIM-barrel fold metal-dependent hydrolase